jgi:competence protein ComEA
MPLTKRQVEGVVALVVLTALIYLFNLLISLFPSLPPTPIPFSNKKAGANAVALAIDGNDEGIFFLPQGATVTDLLMAAGVKPPHTLGEIGTRRLSAGDKVSLARGSSFVLEVGKMPAAQALALGLPLDINHAAFDDMILIPGIGEKTATEIIALREKKGSFRRVQELTEIRGIKEKKLAKLRRYFYAEGR